MNSSEFLNLVINKIKSYGYKIRAVYGDPYHPGVSFPKHSTIVINFNYLRKRRLALIALHEYGHLILHTPCSSYKNYKAKDEAEANNIAINMIVQIYYDEWPCDSDETAYFNNMISALDIPGFLYDEAYQVTKRYMLA